MEREGQNEKEGGWRGRMRKRGGMEREGQWQNEKEGGWRGRDNGRMRKRGDGEGGTMAE